MSGGRPALDTYLRWPRVCIAKPEDSFYQMSALFPTEQRPVGPADLTLMGPHLPREVAAPAPRFSSAMMEPSLAEPKRRRNSIYAVVVKRLFFSSLFPEYK